MRHGAQAGVSGAWCYGHGRRLGQLGQPQQEGGEAAPSAASSAPRQMACCSRASPPSRDRSAMASTAAVNLRGPGGRAAGKQGRVGRQQVWDRGQQRPSRRQPLLRHGRQAGPGYSWEHARTWAAQQRSGPAQTGLPLHCNTPAGQGKRARVSSSGSGGSAHAALQPCGPAAPQSPHTPTCAAASTAGSMSSPSVLRYALSLALTRASLSAVAASLSNAWPGRRLR